LPEFCDFRVVFAVMVLAQLVACVVSLTSPGRTVGTWRGFALTSLYVQWVAVASIGLLCVLRDWLGRAGVARGLALAWVMVMLVAAAGTAAAWWLDRRFALGLGSGYALHRLQLEAMGVSALVAAAALRYLYIQAEWQREVRAQAESRVRALQARIRPHFLFNSMNTIASLIPLRPEEAELAVEDLADLFRGALGERQDTDLATELDLVRRYFHIEQLRLGERLRLDWRIDEVPGDARVPPLLLQPLVENAIYHGIQPRTEGGTVTVSGGLDRDRVWITIENPLPGVEQPVRGGGNQMAQQNIEQRLRYFYKGRGRLEINRQPDSYRVTLGFPYWRSMGEGADR